MNSSSQRTAKKKNNNKPAFVNLDSDENIGKHARLKLIRENRNSRNKRNHFLELCRVGAHGHLKISANTHTGKVTYFAESYRDYATDYLVPFDPYKLNCVGVFQRALTHPNIGLARFTRNLTGILELQNPRIGISDSTGKSTHEGQNPNSRISKHIMLVDFERGPVYVDGHGHSNYLVDDVLSWFRRYRAKHVALLNAHNRRKRR